MSLKGNKKERDDSKIITLDGGEGGIRTHVSVKTNAFRVRPVMTASILLRIVLNHSTTD